LRNTSSHCLVAGCWRSMTRNTLPTSSRMLSPESVLLLGDRDKLDEYKNVDRQTTGVITPVTINTETGALGKDLHKLFIVLRQLTAEEGTEFGRIVGGDLRMAEFGS